MQSLKKLLGDSIMVGQISIAASTVYETLEKIANGNNSCEASYAVLVKKSGYARSSVINAVRELVASNKISKKKDSNEEKGYLPNKYELLM